MKFKKIISAVLVFCLAASSVLSAAAYTVDEKALVDVNGNKRIDVGDALQTLQYSVGKFRKFSAQEKKVFYEGCVGYSGYGISSDDNDENVWFRDLKKEKAIPFMFENFKEKGGVPCFASDNERYKELVTSMYYCDYNAEYPSFDGKFWDESDVENGGNAHWDSLFTATFADKSGEKDLMSELISAFGSKYERIIQYDEIKSGSVDGIDYLYWNGVEGKLSPGVFFKKDGYVICFYGDNPEQDIRDFRIDLIPISKELMNKPLMRRYGDVNNDGKINTEDALMILQYAVGKITAF